jgi:predicted flap endonuclease-1-like 5' DNA nuclease
MEHWSETEPSETAQPTPPPEAAKPSADDEIARLRTSLSLLTAAGADLAAALEKRTREYEGLLGQLNEATRQAEGLRGELQQDVADRTYLREQLNERNTQLVDLYGQYNRLQADLKTLADARAGAEAELGSLQADYDAVTGGRTGLESTLHNRDAELADVRSQYEGLQLQAQELAADRDAAHARLHGREQELAGLQARRAASAPLQAAVSVAETLTTLPPSKTAAASLAIVAGGQPSTSPRLQNLAEIRGIGPVFQQRLYRAGIGTFWEVASLSDEELANALEIGDSPHLHVEWTELRADAFRLARDSGTVGQIWEGHHVDDFEPLFGIGKVFEERLYEAGLYTYDDLAAASVEQLAAACPTPPALTPDFASWIAQAKELVEMRAAAPSEPVEEELPPAP